MVSTIKPDSKLVNKMHDELNDKCEDLLSDAINNIPSNKVKMEGFYVDDAKLISDGMPKLTVDMQSLTDDLGKGLANNKPEGGYYKNAHLITSNGTKESKDTINTPLPVLPLGFHVLVEVIPVQFKSLGGIVLMSETEKSRESKGGDVAKVLAFGPIAFKGFSGCDSHKDWGIEVGDTIELKGRYDGKHSRTGDYKSEHKKLRYVLDSDIIGKLDESVVKQLMNEDK